MFNFTFKAGLLRRRGYAFLAGADHGRCEKEKWTRRYLLGHRRILKKGRLYHTPRKSIFSKGKRRLEIWYFKTAVLRAVAATKRLIYSPRQIKN